MIKITFFITFNLFSLNAFSQMAQPSIFASTKSINPAVIKWRKNGIARLSIETNSVVRKQNITTIKSSSFPINQKDKIRIIDLGLFRGGHGDNGLTSEAKIGYTMGTKSTDLVDSGLTPIL